MIGDHQNSCKKSGRHQLSNAMFWQDQGRETAIEPSELLTAEPAVITNIKFGDTRVTTGEQNLGRQLDMLRAAVCQRIFAEKQSECDIDRPELTACTRSGRW
ncbi:hypothetical protein ACNTMW_30985 [Planosporangium sp. 12N6]|uniref:hypothetical protein n=1 Tax=Planosporangium spinosum TaxID=3402278 RepID=UPI003CF54209